MTTPTPEATEAAARAMFYQQVGLNPPYPLWDDADAIEKDNCRNDAQLALSAAYPLMEAQAKAEALEGMADAILTNDPLDYWAGHLPEGLGFQEAMSLWLRAHAPAATIAPDVTP